MRRGPSYALGTAGPPPEVQAASGETALHLAQGTPPGLYAR